MEKREVFRSALLATALFVFQIGQAQVSIEANVPANPGLDYVGWDNTTTVPLMIRHDANQPIQWFTDSIQRMQLSPTLTNQAWGWYTGGLNLSGHLGIGNPVPQQPLTYLHLNSSGLTGITVGYRPWMRVGTFCTQGTDGLYVGMRAVNGQTHGVLNWSDDDNAANAMDPMCFVFTGQPDSSSAASLYNGLEIARMSPAANGNEGYLGVGDWRTAGATPNERLDILDRTARLRRLIPDYNNDTISRIVVVDTTGRLHWRNISTWPQNPITGASCEWFRNGTAKNVYSGWLGGNTNGGCPDRAWLYGIGLTTPQYKLQMDHNELDRSAAGSIRTDILADGTGQVNGIYNRVATAAGTAGIPVANGMFTDLFNVGQASTPPTADGYGTLSRVTGNVAANFARRHRGLWGDAASAAGTITEAAGVYGTSNITGATVTNAYGVYGESLLSSGTATNRYGVYGRSANVANSWAGYFLGALHVNGVASCNAMAWTSDATLKTNIEPLSGARAIISQLRPSNYRFRTEEFPTMNLPEGLQRGLIAQEVGEVLPELVKNIQIAPVTDHEGVEIAAARTVKGVDYIGLIPVLIGAAQEQQAQVDAMDETQSAQAQKLQDLRARLDELEHLLAACCNNPDRSSLQGPDNATGTLNIEDPATDRKLRIVPNPFSEPPTVFYTLDRGGRMQLIANSADGKELRVLQEAPLQAGDYQYAWDTNTLAPGMYYVTLLLDGQPLVKKAVKVTR